MVTEEHRDFLLDELPKLGYKVKNWPHDTERWGYLAGSDEDRAASIMEAFADPEVDAVFCYVGGYGAGRILDMLDYDVIRENPKVFTGFSDITALHLAIYKKTGLVTFHSPTHSRVYAQTKGEYAYPTDHLWRAIAEEGYEGAPEPGFTIETDSLTTAPLTLVPGTARGPLTGGNLSLVAALMGTPFEIETRGHILFLEDVGEEPYRIDRMLNQLRLAGKLDEVKGVILGRFAKCDPDNPERSFSLHEVFRQYFADRPYPVVMEFPVGHVRENATLPMGIMAELNATEGTLRLLEDPVER